MHGEGLKVIHQVCMSSMHVSACDDNLPCKIDMLSSRQQETYNKLFDICNAMAIVSYLCISNLVLGL